MYKDKSQKEYRIGLIWPQKQGFKWLQRSPNSSYKIITIKSFFYRTPVGKEECKYKIFAIFNKEQIRAYFNHTFQKGKEGNSVFRNANQKYIIIYKNNKLLQKQFKRFCGLHKLQSFFKNAEKRYFQLHLQHRTIKIHPLLLYECSIIIFLYTRYILSFLQRQKDKILTKQNSKYSYYFLTLDLLLENLLEVCIKLTLLRIVQSSILMLSVFSFTVYIIYQQLRLRRLSENLECKIQMFQLLVLISALLLFQMQMLIMAIVLLWETIDLIKRQPIDSSQRIKIYSHLLIALLFLPLFKLFAKQNQDSQDDKFHLQANLCYGIYLFVVYELHFWRIGLPIRKYKFLTLQFVHQKIKAIEVREVCRVCYKSLGDCKNLIEGQCPHKYHKACLAQQKIYICPIDKISLDTNKKE